MYKFTFCFLNILAVIYLSCCEIPEFTRCKEDDFECYVKSTVQVAPLFLNGCPELGIERFSPLFLRGLDASTPHLKFTLGDTTVSGMDTCKSIEMGKTNEGKMYHKFICDLKYDGSVDIKGHWLTFHSEGKGTMNLAYNQILITGMANILKYLGPDNKNHWKFSDYEIHYEMLGEPKIFIVDQLDGKGKYLHTNLGGFLSMHPPRKLVADLSKPLMNVLVTKLYDNVNKLFAVMPAEELVLQ